MNYFECKDVETKIKKDILEIQDFNVDQYIDANFQQFSRQGEYDDNSLDLSYHYKMLKMIQLDEYFMSKLNFVMTNYIKNKK